MKQACATARNVLLGISIVLPIRFSLSPAAQMEPDPEKNPLLDPFRNFPKGFSETKRAILKKVAAALLKEKEKLITRRCKTCRVPIVLQVLISASTLKNV